MPRKNPAAPLDLRREVDIHLNTVNQINPPEALAAGFLLGGLMIQADIDIRDLERLVDRTFPDFVRQVPFATAGALTDTAFALRSNLGSGMREDLDRPTQAVQRMLFVTKATKSDLEAVVAANPNFGSTSLKNVLNPHLGNARRPKNPAEKRLGSYIVPGVAAVLDQYGNMNRRLLASIVDTVERQKGDATRTKGKRSTRAIFKRGNVVYERKGSSIRPLLVLIQEPTYEPRLGWQERTDAIVATHFMPAFEARMEKAIKTAR